MLTIFLHIIIDVYISLLLLRIWLQFVSADSHNPFYQLIINVTQPIIKKLYWLISPGNKIDNTAILLILALITLKGPLISSLQNRPFPGNRVLWFTLLILVKSGIKIVLDTLFMRMIFSWLASINSAIIQILYQLTEPLLKPIRQFLPKFYKFDLSILALMLLMILLEHICNRLLGLF